MGADRALEVVADDSAAPGTADADAKRAARLHYEMMRRLTRVRGVGPVSDLILRCSARAVRARMGAVAVARADAHTTIAATYGYPRALVEHVRIETGVGVIGRVMQSRVPILAEGPDPARPRRLRYRTNSFVVVPIIAGGDVLGAICVTDRVGDAPFGPRDVDTLRAFAAGAALALERERALDSAEAHAHAAAIDPVSGVFNRRYLQVRLGEELQRSRRHEIPLALLLIDIDDFKIVNDSYGHLAGDLVLRDVAEILRRSVRVFDVCARFGGEEFVIIMPGSTADSAMRIAERIRERIELYRPADRLLASLRITVSIGLAVSEPGTTVSQLLARADAALYAAKHAGKNRIRSDQQGRAPEESDPRRFSS
jgi:diguanylate cyclase (GGDEF)-like protein